MTMAPTADALLPLFTEGFARIPKPRQLEGPATAGLCRHRGETVVATPMLLHLAAQLVSLREAVGLLFATEPRYRDVWLRLQAFRLADLGRQQDGEALCTAINSLGPAAGALRQRLPDARLEPTTYGSLEVAVFGAPADQPAAGPGLLRVLSLTAPLVEGGQGLPLPLLAPVHPLDPRENWVPGRLLQAPGEGACKANPFVLSGGIDTAAGELMDWVLKTPWATLLGQLVFMAEAWAAERQGGLALELPPEGWEHFAAPPRVHVAVTLADGREVLCGSLGAFCLRVLDRLGMALVPLMTDHELDGRLALVIGRLLREGVWAYRAVARPEYVISGRFSDDCYRGAGHRYVYLAGERLAEAMRSVGVTWARTLTERKTEKPGA